MTDKTFRVIDLLDVIRMMYKNERNPSTKELYLKYGLSIKKLLNEREISELDEFEDVKVMIWNKVIEFK